MGKYQLTNNADSKIDEIYEYSILNFGLDIAQDYILGLHERFQLLADNPTWGNDYGHIKNGLNRYEYVSHAIYYQQTDEGILIVEVLGSKQDPKRNL
jgi:toxin ParE1/3/4